MKQKNYEIIICIICGREFERYTSNHGARGKKCRTVRPMNTKTCCKSCSKKYNKEAKNE